jgi:ABC-type Fe2+-enterobactin transport system substrate-binding protein
MQREQNASYYHAKGACYLCHQPHDIVDTSIQITGEGVLAICHGCIADLALTSGYLLSDNKAEVESLKAQLAGATKRAEDAEDMLEKIKLYEKRVANLVKGREVLAAQS